MEVGGRGQEDSHFRLGEECTRHPHHKGSWTRNPLVAAESPFFDFCGSVESMPSRELKLEMVRAFAYGDFSLVEAPINPYGRGLVHCDLKRESAIAKVHGPIFRDPHGPLF